MIPGMNQKALKLAMKKMGLKQEEIEASEVIIKCPDKELIVRNPSVQKVNMMGQESLQITGDIEEVEKESFSEEDIKMVVEQTGCSEKEAREVLERNGGDIAKSILELKK